MKNDEHNPNLHPLCEARARVLQDLERKVKRPLTDAEIKVTFKVNDNVARQTRWGLNQL
jgi:hypothetical protein